MKMGVVYPSHAAMQDHTLGNGCKIKVCPLTYRFLQSANGLCDFW